MAQQYEKIDFKGIKESISADRIFDFLGMTMKPTQNPDVLRGPCPVCKRGGDRAITYTRSNGMWACHGQCTPDAGRQKLFGDTIRLVAHVRGIKQPEAAVLLRDTFLREPEKSKRGRRSAKPVQKRKKVDKAVGGIAPEWEHWIGQLS